MQAFCGFSAVFLAFIIPYFDDFCTVYRMIWIVQFTLNKGDVYYADLNPLIGSEQRGVRPGVILQNDIGNKYSRPR